VLADAALRPHADAELAGEPLHQDECRLVTDPPAGLAALRDHAARTRGDRGARLVDRRDLDEHAARREPRDVCRARDDHRCYICGQCIDHPQVGHAHAERADHLARGLQRAPRRDRIATEVEHPENARVPRSHDQTHVGPFERRQADHVIAYSNSHATGARYSSHPSKIEPFLRYHVHAS
jgi:hypothetical protein